MTQLSFATLDHRNKKKRTKREAFLAEMEAVVPWALLLALIEPYYPKAGNGRRPYPLVVMLRIYFLQQWYQLSDPGARGQPFDAELSGRLGEDWFASRLGHGRAGMAVGQVLRLRQRCLRLLHR